MSNFENEENEEVQNGIDVQEIVEETSLPIFEIDLQDIEKASRLVYLGLDSSKSLGRLHEYKELFRSYTRSSTFQDIVHAICQGMNLRLVDIDASGIILSAEDNSVFVARAGDLPLRYKASTRRYLALIMLGIAAFFFPTSQQFSRRGQSTAGLTPKTLDEFIRNTATKAKEKYKPSDPGVEDDEIILFEEYLSLKKDLGKTSSRSSSIDLINQVLKYMKDQKLLVVDNERYYPTKRFKLQMEELSKNTIYKIMIESTGVSP